MERREARRSYPIMWESLSSRRLQFKILINLPPPRMSEAASRRDTGIQYFMKQPQPRHGACNWAAFPFNATRISRPFNGPRAWDQAGLERRLGYMNWYESGGGGGEWV